MAAVEAPISVLHKLLFFVDAFPGLFLIYRRIHLIKYVCLFLVYIYYKAYTVRGQDHRVFLHHHLYLSITSWSDGDH